MKFGYVIKKIDLMMNKWGLNDKKKKIHLWWNYYLVFQTILSSNFVLVQIFYLCFISLIIYFIIKYDWRNDLMIL
jgi:hypothetical protein